MRWFKTGFRPLSGRECTDYPLAGSVCASEKHRFEGAIYICKIIPAFERAMFRRPKFAVATLVVGVLLEMVFCSTRNRSSDLAKLAAARIGGNGF